MNISKFVTIFCIVMTFISLGCRDVKKITPIEVVGLANIAAHKYRDSNGNLAELAKLIRSDVDANAPLSRGKFSREGPIKIYLMIDKGVTNEIPPIVIETDGLIYELVYARGGRELEQTDWLKRKHLFGLLNSQLER